MEDSQKNLINSIIFLVKIFAGLKDKFLAQKLYDKTSVFIAGYIKLFSSKREEDDASHNIFFIEFKNTMEGLLEFLDYLEHSKSVSITPLLYARKNLLNLKLDLVRLRHQPVWTVPKPKENKPSAFVHRNVAAKKLKESSNKDKIFNFIKRSPNSRTKEIIEEFSILSERTVKRNLKELTEEGFLRKWTKDQGVYYAAI